MAALVAELDTAGVTPVGYRATRVPAAPLAPDAQLLAQLAADDIAGNVNPDVNVIYDLKGVALADHVADMTAYYQRKNISGTPIVDWVSVEVPVTATDLGTLANLVTITGDTPAQKPNTATSGHAKRQSLAIR